MKVIQVSMQEELLRAMTRKAKAARQSRAALIRTACEDYLRKLDEEQLDRRYVESYRRVFLCASVDQDFDQVREIRRLAPGAA